MPNFVARYRKTAPKCNPEYTSITIEARGMNDAKKKAAEMDFSDLHPGWISRGEPEYWGKPADVELLEVVDA